MHPDFRSIVSGIYNADDVEDVIGTALLYQHTFDRRTSPWEMAEWDEGELENFAVDTGCIDRLYHIFHHDDGVSGREFELLARMKHNNRSIYFQMTASCNFTGFDSVGGGEIYLTLDPQVFLKSIVGIEYNPHDVWESMVQDGLDVEEPSDFDQMQVKAWHSVPMLQFLCNMKVYDDQDSLQHYEEVLPHSVAANVEKFMRIRHTRDHHDNGC